MLRGALVAVLFLAPLALAQAPGPALAPAPAPWWETALADADRDGLDDALPRAGPDALSVLAAFPRVPTPRDVAGIEAAGFQVTRVYQHFDVVAVRALPADLPRLLEVPGVVFVERDDAIERLLAQSVPLIGADQVWEAFGATGKGVTVAVLDDGAFEQHPDFDGKVAASFDASASTAIGPITLPANVPVVPASEEGHATHVVGTIIGPGTSSSGRFVGVSPDAAFVDIKVFSGPGQTNSNIVLTGLDWTIANADRLGVRIISMSLGGSASDGRDALSRAVNVAVDKGFIVVAAAGNAGPGPSTIASPGAAEKAITVGAVDKRKAIASYSSRGPLKGADHFKPDIVAPGSAIVSTVPPASTSAVQNVLRQSTELFYGELSGTSMAAPHVSGVVALMLEVNPDLSPLDVKQMLIATAQDLGAQGRDNDTGYGFVNAIAAVQVANDPTLLDSPEFAAILNTLPPPAAESFSDRVQYEIESAMRTGRIWVWGAIAAGTVAVALGVVLVVRAVRR